MTREALATIVSKTGIISVNGFAFGKPRIGNITVTPGKITLSLGDTQVFCAGESTISDGSAIDMLLMTMKTFSVTI